MLVVPVTRRWTRPLALAAAVGVGAVTLAACTKPLPEVTFQSGSRSVLVEPGQYCFTTDKATCHLRSPEQRTLLTQPGGSIAISVPRTVASNAWVATAYTVGTDGKTNAVQGAGSNLVVGKHTTRVFVPLQSGSYQLAVTEVQGQQQTGTWVLQVQIGT